ncbi:flavin monoamine oxidase family protein [Bradyrhizobium sp. ISRA443]|uniref:NAD(P)/FAD-dependent oxidoreductase n=1 Tax=unclassified Bradyrhizobium TaxID=2631580 RepID=UPI00247920EA|nr:MULTISPECIES: flavin monoamine oxidase family protein [unclassified Bradyrhizobium]WGR90997.1 flavin monoamine oxidase family protein [Bradyrhizobium sp. ISRA435]WGS01146.1 flavin monoamine oxidase family protein [Bradyrhizobium sp. ISRA436]WGS08033.1 flavin monoamine oxidase family protein [Bradyrhizobium sp. ISRA437]WGS14921.1 flavin monoamine oxidase family protein [Bradyrhizobium sp. ISRA443]
MQNGSVIKRRDLLALIGTIAGSSVMYHAMTSLGFASESAYKGPLKLEGNSKGASVLILGAGLAGMTAALELRKAGYKVQILEFNSRPGGRNWTIRGGDSFVELGGFRQTCEFEQGLYINPGPWRIPYHHRALLDYCRRLNVALEPFIQLNHNAYLHATRAFNSRPQRIRSIKADFQGWVSELLAKVTQQGKLDETVTKEDQEILLQSLRAWGALDRDYKYSASLDSAAFRGYTRDPGGGLTADPLPSDPIALSDILRSQLWRYLQAFARYNFQTTMFQPVGGMDMIGKAFAREVGDLIRYNAKVTQVQQNGTGVTVSYVDTANPSAVQQAIADWCICTIPLSILSQLPIDVGTPMKNAIDALPYAASVKIGLQFKRRFWEEDEAIYGGISFTDLPIRQIAYPNYGFNRNGRGILLGGYVFEGANSYEFTAMTPAERVKSAVEFGAVIHPQYKDEFETGVAVAWHRVPFTLGCSGEWSDAGRAQHYRNLCQIDGRIVLAGEHASDLPAWQEGAILSSLDAVSRLHERVVKT